MNTQKCVTTSVENINSEVISLRQCTEPTKKVKQVFDLMNYKYTPFWRKKSIASPAEISKIDNS